MIRRHGFSGEGVKNWGPCSFRSFRRKPESRDSGSPQILWTPVFSGKTNGEQSIQTLGFTLLEVMIAIAILSLVAVAFLRAQASSIRLVDESVQISMATLLAKERMAELESRGFPEPGSNSGAWGEAFPSYRWEQTISTTEIPNIRKGVVRVLWMEGDLQKSMELTLYIARR